MELTGVNAVGGWLLVFALIAVALYLITKKYNDSDKDAFLTVVGVAVIGGAVLLALGLLGILK